MKNKIVSLSLVFACIANAATETDLVKGIDMTGQSRVTAAQLNQLVDNGTVQPNKGVIIWSKTPPDVSSNPRYTNFLWLDATVNPPILKGWASGSIMTSPNMSSNWLAASVGTGGVTTDKLADYAVTSQKLATNAVLTWNIATNQIVTAHLQDGIINTKKLGAQVVTSNNILNLTIVSDNIADATIEANAKLKDRSITYNKIAIANVRSVEIATNTVENYNMAVNSIADTNLINGSVTAAKLANNIVDGNKLVPTNIITADMLQNSVSNYVMNLVTNGGYSPKAICTYTANGTDVPALVSSASYNINTIAGSFGAGATNYVITFKSPIAYPLAVTCNAVDSVGSLSIGSNLLTTTSCTFAYMRSNVNGVFISRTNEGTATIIIYGRGL